jgi:hypothetical protein
MNTEQIKGEIRKLSGPEKIEVCRWIDHEAAVDLLSRIGVYRSREIPKGVEQKRRVIS